MQNRRYDDRNNYGRRYGGSDRDRRDNRHGGSGGSRERDFRDGNRDRRTRGDNLRGHDRGVPKKEKDDKADSHTNRLVSAFY